MKIVCASSVLYGEEAFSSLGEVTVLPEESIRRDALCGADILVTRSKTRIGRDLLEGTGVRFVGCTVSGVDHMDTDYLNDRGLAWCAAAGCNAPSVAEYVVSALLTLTRRHGLNLSGKTVGVIGVGHIGARVVRMARAMGLDILMNDPPRRAATGDPQFLPLERVLEASDILTLHVPLTDAGPCATRRMADCPFFGRMKPGCLFINTARGEVVDTEALLLALERGVVLQAALDVWENEPDIDRRVLEAVDIGTPHIAGYSFEGRLNGTHIVYRELCHFLETEPAWTPPRISPELRPDPLDLDARGRLDEEVLWEMVRHAYDADADSRCFKAGVWNGGETLAEPFVRYRRAYPDRPGFSDHSVRLAHAEPALVEKARALGFTIIQ